MKTKQIRFYVGLLFVISFFSSHVFSQEVQKYPARDNYYFSIGRWQYSPQFKNSYWQEKLYENFGLHYRYDINQNDRLEVETGLFRRSERGVLGCDDPNPDLNPERGEFTYDEYYVGFKGYGNWRYAGIEFGLMYITYHKSYCSESRPLNFFPRVGVSLGLMERFFLSLRYFDDLMFGVRSAGLNYQSSNGDSRIWVGIFSGDSYENNETDNPDGYGIKSELPVAENVFLGLDGFYFTKLRKSGWRISFGYSFVKQ